MADISFSVVQRPTKALEGFPPKLSDAIARTVETGQAIRIDTSRWTKNRARMLYRAAFRFGQSTPYVLHRRKTATELYFWGEPKR
jgi:hypothetical protein